MKALSHGVDPEQLMRDSTLKVIRAIQSEQTLVGIQRETTAATLVAYLPEGVVDPATADTGLRGLAAVVGVEVAWTAATAG